MKKKPAVRRPLFNFPKKRSSYNLQEMLNSSIDNAEWLQIWLYTRRISRAEWQEMVDTADILLLTDKHKLYALVAGGKELTAAQCRRFIQIIETGQYLGVFTSVDEDQFVKDFMNGMIAISDKGVV